MKESFIKKHPVILSFAYVVLLAVFSSISTVIAIVFKMSPVETMLIQVCGFLLSSMLALLIMKKSKCFFREYGLRIPEKVNKYGIWGFILLVVMEGIPLFLGIDRTITPSYFIILLLWIVAAVINEELYFRGLIIKSLKVKGTSYAIIISSVLFGVAHLGNLALGKGLAHSVLFVAFSMLIGFIYAEIAIMTRSVLVPIILHFIHNIVSSITVDTSYGITLTIVSVQCAVLLSFAVYLWLEIKKKSEMYISKVDISN